MGAWDAVVLAEAWRWASGRLRPSTGYDQQHGLQTMGMQEWGTTASLRRPYRKTGGAEERMPSVV